MYVSVSRASRGNRASFQKVPADLGAGPSAGYGWRYRGWSGGDPAPAPNVYYHIQEKLFGTILEDSGPLVRAIEQDMQFVLKHIGRELEHKLAQSERGNLPALASLAALDRFAGYSQGSQDGW